VPYGVHGLLVQVIGTCQIKLAFIYGMNQTFIRCEGSGYHA